MARSRRAGKLCVMTNDILNEAGTKIRTFRRSRENRMLAGVCGGAAELLGVDAALLRVGMVVGTVFFAGAGIVLYAACWLLVPEAESE
ncbi:phage shock protein PspC (stress-responsive transcriptional regulator) [Kutzneria buriramensis]|uniref:Phage shock protein PspC (Stress-responsive transcriptional regulator) n=2 Tax=Kutzneria buriramensis TaxID=1045776 RepID=A0A3E0HV30_9PSEU|nr:phage shock protein PspC (stress-responsive transcriptional regulator) [Kutzneria buriramensis]